MNLINTSNKYLARYNGEK